jgi:hypothetical protein
MPIDAKDLVPSLWDVQSKPSPTNTWPLGSPSLAWSNLYLGPNGANAFDPTTGNIGYYARTAAEIAAGVTPTNYVYPSGHLWRYGNVSSGGDITTALGNALASNNGATVYIPLASAAYTLNSGITISGHTGTKITCDPNASITSSISSGYVITITNCVICDFQFPQITCATSGANGILMNSTSASTTQTQLGVVSLVGPGIQGTKPANPLATGSVVGIYIQGPAAGKANYYHIIKQGTSITKFDTGIAFATPLGGIMNANANIAIAPHIEQFWFGFYTNSVENFLIGAQFYNAAGTDGSHLAECVRLGDGTLATNFNTIYGVAEPGGSNTQFANCLSSSLNNIIIAQDNCDHSPTDSGKNQIWTHNTFASGAPWTLRNGLTLPAPSPAADTATLTAAASQVALQLNAAASGSTAVRVVGAAAGTPVITLNTMAQTGAKTISLTLTGFPGTNAGAKAIQYVPAIIDGSKCWVLTVPD